MLMFGVSDVATVGVEGMVDAYRKCLPQVKLYGPTNFAPIIRHVSNFAQQAQQQNTASVSIIIVTQYSIVMEMICLFFK